MGINAEKKHWGVLDEIKAFSASINSREVFIGK